jgi:competence protein ComEC
VILLLVTPESLHDAGFQLSYAATVALVGGYGALSRAISGGRAPRWMMPVYALVLTSVVAGAATAPFAAAHFNRFTDYGLLANLLTVWAMSALMAAGVVAAVLAPFGAEYPALWVMEMSGVWILAVAQWVSGLEGSVTAIATPHHAVLPLITLGGIWILVWQGRRRLIGLPVLALALAIWAATPRPDVLISGDGRLTGLMDSAGLRSLSHDRGAGFAARTWLENDGDLAAPQDSAARAGFDGPRGARAFVIGPYRAVMLSGKDTAAAFSAACAAYDIVILPAAFDTAAIVGPMDAGGKIALSEVFSKTNFSAAATEPNLALKTTAPCLRIDRAVLDRTGPLAGQIIGQKLVLHPARSAQRIWSSPNPTMPPIVLDSAGLNTKLAKAN